MQLDFRLVSTKKFRSNNSILAINCITYLLLQEDVAVEVIDNVLEDIRMGMEVCMPVIITEHFLSTCLHSVHAGTMSSNLDYLSTSMSKLAVEIIVKL